MKNITNPTLILNKQTCLQHLRDMQDLATRQNLQLAPHFKTHQSVKIGKWCKTLGISAITVSSLDMAEAFAADGWEDITWAFPVNIRAINQINRIAEKASLSLYINELESASFLSKHLSSPVRCFIEIDTGYHRSGISHTDLPKIEELVQTIAETEKILFRGFYTHAGHSYGARSQAEIIAIHEDTRTKLLAVKKYFEDRHFSVEIALGDTPTCSIAQNFGGIDIIRPGNFVFYDLMQAQIGSCKESDISVVLAAPVVEKHPERDELIVHGGAVHLSKDRLIDEEGRTIYGKVVPFEPGGWGHALPNVYVKALSQEHGVIHWPGEKQSSIKIGDLIGILPIHSCLTANLMGTYVTTDGEQL